MSKSPRFALHFCLVVAAITLIATNWMKNPLPTPTASISVWNVYEGQVSMFDTVYDVNISESNHGNQPIRRMIHLVVNEIPRHKGISGHDYDADGEWDRVFYCGNHDMIDVPLDGKSWGCNSVVMTEDGWQFEACSADEGKIKPFSPAAIAFAIGELDSAMDEVHSIKHLTRHQVYDRIRDRTIVDQHRF